MGFNFPNTPSENLVFNAPNGVSWIYKGGVWKLNSKPGDVLTAKPGNRFVNPTFNISQDNGGAVVTAQAGYPADMIILSYGGIVAAAQYTTMPAPSPDGTLAGVSLYATTAKASLAASDILTLVAYIEGVDVDDFLWGTVNAKPIVVRFCAVADAAGKYAFTVHNSANDRSWCGSFTIATPNVPQIFEIAIPGDTTGTWLKDTGIGLRVRFNYAVGSTYVGVEGWQAGNMLAPPGCANGAATANSKLYVTDLGVYVDPYGTGKAPPYEQVLFADAYARCQRYLAYAVVGAQAPGVGYALVPFFLPTPMRITPTLSIASAGSGSGATVANDTVAGNTGGYFQITTTTNGGYWNDRRYKLSARFA